MLSYILVRCLVSMVCFAVVARLLIHYAWSLLRFVIVLMAFVVIMATRLLVSRLPIVVEVYLSLVILGGYYGSYDSFPFCESSHPSSPFRNARVHEYLFYATLGPVGDPTFFGFDYSYGGRLGLSYVVVSPDRRCSFCYCSVDRAGCIHSSCCFDSYSPHGFDLGGLSEFCLGFLVSIFSCISYMVFSILSDFYRVAQFVCRLSHI